MKTLNYFMLLLLGILISWGNFSYAETNENLFQSANKAYSKGNYKSAIESYRKIIDNGYCSKEVYFNLGNSYLKADSIPQAILYYEKAKILDPTDEDITLNLKFANVKTTDKIEVIPQLFIVGWFQSLLNLYSLTAWAWLSILAAMIACILFFGYINAKTESIKRLTFFGGCIFILITASLVFISFAVSKSQSSKRAVVFSASVTLKSEPNQTATSLFVIHEGATCKIIENLDTWYRVKFDNGNEGWLQSQDIIEI